MSTIFTDELANQDVEVTIGDPILGEPGRELCIASPTHEVRLVLTEEQLAAIASEIEMADIGWREA